MISEPWADLLALAAILVCGVGLGYALGELMLWRRR